MLAKYKVKREPLITCLQQTVKGGSVPSSPATRMQTRNSPRKPQDASKYSLQSKIICIMPVVYVDDAAM